MGVDIATGKAHDYHAIEIYDIEAMEQATSRYEVLQDQTTDGLFDEGGATSTDLAAGNGVS